MKHAHFLDRRQILQGGTVAALALSFGGALTSCKTQQRPPDKIEPTGEEAKLSFFNWDTYIGDRTLPDFKQASGTAVTMSYFANNDELFAALQRPDHGYDVIVPSDDAVTRMLKADLLQPLDHKLIPNFANVMPDFRDVPFDPKRRFSMPYTWFVMGIGYRKSKFQSPPDSWKWVLDSAEHKGKIAIPGEADDLFHLYSLYLGRKMNAISPEQVVEIEAMLMRQKPNLQSFHDDNGQELLLSGDVDLVVEYNGDMAQAIARDSDIGFVIPKEGSQLNSDNLAIPKGAPHPKNAHAFINFLLDGAVGQEITQTILYPTPNMKAREAMPASYSSNEVIFPPREAMARCYHAQFDEVLQPLFEDALARVRAA